MPQLFHCIVFLFVILFLVEIREVLVNGDPEPQTLTIWEEAQRTL